MPKEESSGKIAKSPEATGNNKRNNKRNNKKPQTVVRLMGAAEVEKSFKKIKKLLTETDRVC